MAEVTYVKQSNDTSILTVNLNDISAKCMKIVCKNPEEWIENLVSSRCQPAIENIWHEHVKECIKQNTTPKTKNELIVGCCFSRINDLPSFMGIKRTGYIAETVVSDACRGKGIGQSLVEKTLGYFKEKGCNAVELQVAVQNPKGIKFWEKLGFSPSTYHMHKVF